jgi:hypothetical protein
LFEKRFGNGEMGRTLKIFILGLVLCAAGIALLQLNFYVGLVTVGIGVLTMNLIRGEMFSQTILWVQRIVGERKGVKNRATTQPSTQTTRITSAKSPFVIANPTIGFLNLSGNEGEKLAQHDRDELSSGFSAVSSIESNEIPRCNVLFLYCTLDVTGRIPKQPYSLRDVIRTSGAHIAVLASEIPHSIVTSSEFRHFLQSKNDWTANIIITLNRNGEAFDRFFKILFSLMCVGMTMPLAWVKLAPQGPANNADNPGTLALLEAGHITFAVGDAPATGGVSSGLRR